MVLAQTQTQISGTEQGAQHQSHAPMVNYLDKGDKNKQWRKKVSSINGAEKNWTATCKKIRLEYFLTSYTKIDSKQIKDQNTRLESIKLLEENIDSTLFDIKLSNIFGGLVHQAMETNVKTNKRHLIKLKSFWISKEISN